MAGNAVLARHAEPALVPLRADVTTTHETATTYTEAAYQAGSWLASRRTIIKADVVGHHGRAPRDNPRFVITNHAADACLDLHAGVPRPRRQ